ncbi:MAG: UDP-N-acetylmuramoyl-L-alanyl-D-glutamate--2,6-diaminopimelate ligase [Deltaproteobacteria bacterium]|nr:UDP-N-acetylmuramoyl-L-alanyl-D-glutamate--2,6-diaminopimelate ligase [Deltaproteobacteria bacterium]
MIALSVLLEGVRVLAVHGDVAVPIAGVVFDSRRAGPGSCFVALPGTNVDGVRFAGDAVNRGAVAVVAAAPLDPQLRERSVWVQVEDPVAALASIAAAYHGRPMERLVLLGVTGTNGKTTVSYLLEGALAAAGLNPGVIGTIEFRFGGRAVPATHTTPDALALNDLGAQMVAAGVTHVAIEVSSHALALGRVAGLRFRGAAFTNLSRDHLDFHQTLAAYEDAKLGLFRGHLAPGALAVIALDDPAGDRFAGAAREAGARVARFSTRLGAKAELGVEDVRYEAGGTHAVLRCFGERHEADVRLIGEHNVANLLAAVGLAHAAGVPLDAAVRGAAGVASVPGRLERVAVREGIFAFVDYSHTPDALAHAVATLRPLCRGRLWVLFGCGGDRDRGKRPQMGRVAAGGDRIVLTSDNPRTEDPEAILDEIEPGLREAGLRRVDLARLGGEAGAYAREVDRRVAIEAMVSQASAGDVLLVAGKGHEDYQIVGREKRHFDDREEVRKAAARPRG